MSVDSETYMAVCDQVQELRQQLAAANEENERVRQANLHTMDVFEDMKAAKEEAEVRVAELEAEALYLRARDDSLVDFLCNESGVDIVSVKAACGHIPNEDAWLLRKQAEAVEVLAKRFQDAADKADRADEDESDTALTLIIAKSVALKEAYQLRQKADETERAGGGQ